MNDSYHYFIQLNSTKILPTSVIIKLDFTTLIVTILIISDGVTCK
jgi:hypothetical protein